MSRKDGEEDVLDSSSEHFLEQEPGHAAGRQLLVGVDAPITVATQYMLRTVSTLFAPYPAHLHLLLLTVISLPYQAGRYTVPYPSFPTHEQWTLAEETLEESVQAESVLPCIFWRTAQHTPVLPGLYPG
jgi:hypothetical protein